MENTKCGDLIRCHLTNHNAIMFYVCNTVCNKKILIQIIVALISKLQSLSKMVALKKAIERN